MVNKLMKKDNGKTAKMVPVRNLSGIDQFHGLYKVPGDGEWVDIPEDLAVRLADDSNYDIADPKLNRRQFTRRASSTASKHVDIIIPVHNQLGFLKQCVASIRQYTTDYSIIVIDDASDNETADWIKKQKFDCVIRHEKPRGFGRSCNEGIAKSTAPWICLLNSDTLVTPHWLSTMLSVASLGFDIVGPTTSHSSGPQCDHSITPKRIDMKTKQVNEVADKKLREHMTDYLQCDVFGFCILFSSEVVKFIGGLDHKRYLDGYYEDWDFVWRAQRYGFKSAWAKGSYVHHYGGTSFYERIGAVAVQELSERNRLVFEKRVQDETDLYFDIKENMKNDTSSPC